MVIIVLVITIRGYDRILLLLLADPVGPKIDRKIDVRSTFFFVTVDLLSLMFGAGFWASRTNIKLKCRPHGGKNKNTAFGTIA